jgi:glycosyltransferase involved in cell wall biosynthesis
LSSSLPVHLAFPTSHGEISGGHIYNARLAEGFAARGALSTLPIERLHVELTAGKPGFFLLDSLDLERVASLPEPGSQQRLGLIAHHLPSLDCFGEEAATRRAMAQSRERTLLARFDLVVATGAFALNYLLELGVPRSRVALIPPAGPPGIAMVPRPTIPPVRALLVANVIPRKGVMELLEALASELRDDHAFELAIVGRLDLDAAYAARCSALIASTPLSRVVRLLGAVPPDEVAGHYQKAHLFVSSSRMETFGMALQEARSFGLPLFALDAGNVAEHVTAGAGRLFDSIASLARALLELVEAPENMTPFLKQAEHARANPSYDWISVADALLDACSRTAALRRPTP